MPRQNGVVGLKHRHLLNVVQALLFHLNTPIWFWNNVVLIVCPHQHDTFLYSCIVYPFSNFEFFIVFKYTPNVHRRQLQCPLHHPQSIDPSLSTGSNPLLIAFWKLVHVPMLLNTLLITLFLVSHCLIFLGLFPPFLVSSSLNLFRMHSITWVGGRPWSWR